MVAYGDDNRKKVRFLYYQTRIDCYENGRKVHKKFDLTVWGSDVMANLDIVNSNYEFGGDTVRLQSMKINYQGLLELRFTRLSEVQTAYVASKNTEDESDFDLEENEYPAQDTIILFDPSNCVAMVQRNIQGLSIRGIIEYINHFWNKHKNETDTIDFLPIVSQEIFSKVKKKGTFKTITIKTANTFNKDKTLLIK